MHTLELLLIAVGLAMDAFAASICKGLSLSSLRKGQALTVGMYFGTFQAFMPLCGYLLAMRFAHWITNIDHWVAFILLGLIGGNMIKESLESRRESASIQKSSKDRTMACANAERKSASPELAIKEMLPLAIATSIDAMAVGISFAFLQVSILPAVVTIGATTLLLSMGGVAIGHVFGAKYKSRAELCGGIILVGMGLKILLEHTGIL